MSDPARILSLARHELGRLPQVLDAFLAGLDDATWRARPAPDRWSPLEIVCHLRDEESEDFGARMRVVAGGGGSFAPIRPEKWVEERRYRDEDPAGALLAFRNRRIASLEFLDTLVPSPERLLATGEAGGGALRLSGLDLLVAWVAHDELHLRQLAGTRARLWADAFTTQRADYAGRLPYTAAD